MLSLRLFFLRKDCEEELLAPISRLWLMYVALSKGDTKTRGFWGAKAGKRSKYGVSEMIKVLFERK
jgi:hypothetical protein